jgi:hypothetical protein
LAVQAVASPRAADAQGRIRRVTVDLSGPVVDSVLPFDEPFLMVGAAPDSLLSVEVRYWRVERNQSRSCSDTLPRVAPRVWTRRQKVSGRQFALLVGPLVAERNYKFCFRIGTKPAADEARTVKDGIAAALDVLTRASASPPTGGATPVARAATADAICRRLPTLFKVDGLYDGFRLLPGSALDCGWPERFGQLARVESLQTLDRARLDHEAAALSASERLRATLLTLGGDSAAASTAALRRAVAVAGPYTALASRVLTRDADSAGSLAQGAWSVAAPEAAGPVPLDSARAPSDLAPRIANLGALAVAFDSLRDLAVLGMERATPAENVDLRRLADRWAGAVADVRREQAELHEMAAALAARADALEAAADRVTREIYDYLELLGTTTGDFLARGGTHFTANLGFAWFPKISLFAPIIGMNFYLRAVNRDVPLSALDGWRRRASLVLAVTTGSVARTGLRDDLIANRGFVVGIGWRFTDFLQIGGGALLLRAPDPDPVVDHSTIKATPYITLTIDATLSSVIGAFTNPIFK